MHLDEGTLNLPEVPFTSPKGFYPLHLCRGGEESCWRGGEELYCSLRKKAWPVSKEEKVEGSTLVGSHPPSGILGGLERSSTLTKEREIVLAFHPEGEQKENWTYFRNSFFSAVVRKKGGGFGKRKKYTLLRPQKGQCRRGAPWNWSFCISQGKKKKKKKRKKQKKKKKKKKTQQKKKKKKKKGDPLFIWARDCPEMDERTGVR